LPGSKLTFFPEDELHALQSGVPFSNLLKKTIDVPSSRSVRIIAHSLGNMVVNSALLQPNMEGVIDAYVMNDAAVAAEAFADDYLYSLFEIQTMFPHAVEYGYGNDQRWRSDWDDMRAGRPPTKDREGFEFPNFADLIKWTEMLRQESNPALFPQPEYALRWRQTRPATGVPPVGGSATPERGPWRGIFASNTRKTAIYNTYNSTDLVLTGAWVGSVGTQKPNLGPLGLLADDRSTQFWATLTNTGPEEEYLWDFRGNHANITRQWAELAHWFPPISVAAGSSAHQTLRSYDFSSWGGVHLLLSHSYMAGRPLPDVWGAFGILKGLLDE
jgi:hypothetical protein